MKWKHWSQNLLAASAVVGFGMGLVSCGASNTIDYLYATSSKNNPGQINVYRVDSESGALSQIGESPYNAGRNPVSLAILDDGSSLYVANHDDNTVEQFNIGTDAKLYAQHTVNPTGSDPVAVTTRTYFKSDGVTVAAEFLFVVETYQPGFSDQNTGPGALFVYNLGTNGTLSSTSLVQQNVNGVTQDYVPLGNTPTAVNVTDDPANLVTQPASSPLLATQVFVTEQLTSQQLAAAQQSGNTNCSSGGVQAYNMILPANGDPPTGMLTPVTNSPFCVGTTPSAIASVHQYGTFLYVTDSAQNQINSFQIQKTTTASVPQGAITPLPSGPVATGTTPDGIVVDPRNDYVYVSNFNGSSISGYAINQGTGGLSPLGTGGTGTTGAQPGCVIVEPALGRYVYTANFVDNSISGFVLNPNNGALSATQGQFYATSGQSTCVAATQHGNHPVINPTNASGIQ